MALCGSRLFTIRFKSWNVFSKIFPSGTEMLEINFSTNLSKLQLINQSSKKPIKKSTNQSIINPQIN